MEVTINVGLNNNPYDAVDVAAELNELAYNMGFDVITKVEVGEYEGNEEMTVVAKFSDKENYFDISDVELWQFLLMDLCHEMHQDCIPYKMSTGECELVYHSLFKGERYEFSDEYFIEG